MIQPVHIETEHLLVHTFRAEDIKKENVVIREIFAIFNEEQTTRYLPQKKQASLKEAALYFRGNLLNYHADKNFLHFITEKQGHKIVGIIDVISPQIAREHYRLDHYPYFIEFCLKSEYQMRGIMGSLLPAFITQLREKDIKEIGAVVNRGNEAAKKLLKKSGFVFRDRFDIMQDYYINKLN